MGVLRMSVAALVIFGACTGSGSAAPARTAAATAPANAPAAPETAVGGAWRRITPPPIPPAGGMAAAWTGRQLVVWGGGAGGGGNWQASDDGAAYDPVADRWEVLPPAPVPGRIGATAVWTGREVLFWGGQTGPAAVAGDGAAYDPAARRWRTLPAAPIGGRTQSEAVWTGREMVVWGGYARCCPVDSVIHDPAAAAFDPATGRWRPMAAVPGPWSGDDGFAATVTAGGQPLIWRRGHLGAYDPAADAWHEVPGDRPPPAGAGAVPGRPSPPSPPSPPSASTADPVALAVTAGDEIYTWTGSAGQGLSGLAYRPSTSVWRRVAPLDGQFGAAVTAGPPGRVYATAGQSARVLEYRVAEDRWSELPLPPVPTRSGAVLVWTGTDLLVWGGNGDEGPEMDGATWHCC